MYLAIKLAKQQIAWIIVATFALTLAVTNVAFAAGGNVAAGGACNADANCAGALVCRNNVCADAVNAGGEDVFGINPVKNTTKLGGKDVRSTIADIINVALGLLGTIAVVIVLAGGFQWMTAGGNEEKVGGAKKLIISGVIGLAIIMSAFAITKFVINELGTATSTKGFQRIE